MRLDVDLAVESLSIASRAREKLSFKYSRYYKYLARGPMCEKIATRRIAGCSP